MRKTILLFTFVLLLAAFFCNVFAQQKNDSLKITKQDTAARKNILSLDTSAKKFNPRVATFRSAVLPGWGQAYNKKYWKIPVVYGALGTTAGIFFYNLKTYKILKQAIILRSDNNMLNDSLVAAKYRNLSTESIRRYRNDFRQNIDYSVLFFIIFWGLNVADATVDAHLKAFDVSDDISLKLKIGHSEFSNTTGLSFVFAFRDNHAKGFPSYR